MLGTLAGLVIFVGGAALLGLIFLIALASLGNTKASAPHVPQGAYLVVDLGISITDSPPPWDGGGLAALTGGPKGPEVVQTRVLIDALERVATDGRIAGLVLQGNLAEDGYGNGLATLMEVRAALQRVKAAGKPILGYAYYASTSDLLLLGTADALAIDPYGALLFPGLASEQLFLTGAFEKLGIGVQVAKVGKFKSAVEPYLLKEMSPEARAQLESLLGDLWTEVKGAVAADRGVSEKVLQQLADEKGILTAQQAKEAGLVNSILYREELEADLCERTGQEERDGFLQVSLSDYLKLLPGGKAVPPGLALAKQEDRVAVVYAEGAIVEGYSEVGEVGGETFAEELRRLRLDPSVKAIVLRVNSPGGSVGAAEHIQRELRLAQEEKPVVVSMGTYAASGGYWISAYAERIFAEKTTITGSIGVFGLQFNGGELARKLGLSFDGVKTAERGDMLSLTRPKTDGEMAVFQGMVEQIYSEFLTKVAEGRAMTPERVDQIGQGRVWSGERARQLGLVDEVGGLKAAVAYAAEKAGLSKENPPLEEFPRRKGFEDFLAEFMQGMGQARAPSGVWETWAARAEREWKALGEYNDPRGLYARLPWSLNLP